MPKTYCFVYALGNLVSNQRWEDSNGGIMTTVDIDRETHKIVAIDFIPVYVHKGSLMNERRNYYCIPTEDYLRGDLPFTLPNDPYTTRILSEGQRR